MFKEASMKAFHFCMFKLDGSTTILHDLGNGYSTAFLEAPMRCDATQCDASRWFPVMRFLAIASANDASDGRANVIEMIAMGCLVRQLTIVVMSPDFFHPCINVLQPRENDCQT